MSIGGSGSKVAEKTQKVALKGFESTTAQATDTAGDLVDFSRDFFDRYIKPQLPQIQTATDTGVARNTEIYDTQSQYAADREGTYQGYGKPAIEQFQTTAKNYSTDQYAEEQAQRGLGDVAQQGQIASESLDRAYGARGVNPASTASAKAVSTTTIALAKAAAANRARDLAKSQGLTLQNQAAQIGVGLGQLSPGITANQVNTVGQGAAIPTNAIGAIAQAGKPLQSGLSDAAGIYGQASGNYGSLTANTTKDAQAAANAESEGWGKLAGAVIGTGLNFALPGSGTVFQAAMSGR